MGATAGATVGWLWWAQLVVVIAAESVGAAGLLATLWPALPVAPTSLVFMLVFTAINLLGIRNFGEFEFWFAILKVVAVLAFIGVGALLLLGLLPGVASPGLTHFFADGGFAPKGWAGIGAALLVVVFAFGGTEIVAVAAAETEDPERSIARAIRTVVWRILVFYVGSLAVIIAVVPWTSQTLKSPFAAVLQHAGIPGAAEAITLVAVVALLSALNANLYGASRMIFSLAERGEAPRLLAHLDRRQVPVVAVLSSVAFGFFATGLELLYPSRVLPALLKPGRLHLPGGVDDLAAVAMDPAPTRRSRRHAAGVPHAGLSVAERTGPGDARRGLRAGDVHARPAPAAAVDCGADARHRRLQRAGAALAQAARSGLTRRRAAAHSGGRMLSSARGRGPSYGSCSKIG